MELLVRKDAYGIGNMFSQAVETSERNGGRVRLCSIDLSVSHIAHLNIDS